MEGSLGIYSDLTMQECCDYEDYDNRVNIIEVHHLQRKQKQFLALTPVVELTQRYVAPNQEIHFNQQNQTSNEKKGRRKLTVGLDGPA